MKIALVNMNISWKNKIKNIQKQEKHIQELKKIDKKIETIIFPELACTGFVLEKKLEDIAENKNGYCIKETKKLAKKYKVNIINGFIQKNKNKKPYNSLFVIGKNGELKTIYNKNHLFTQNNSEENFYSKGEKLSIFKIGKWKCGIATCFDIRFPRLFEKLAQNGAEIIFISSNWIKDKNKFKMLKTLTQARAIENQIYITNIDRIGFDPNALYTGSWMFSDPIGLDISKTYKKIYHIGEIKKEKIKEIRKKIPLQISWKEKYKLTLTP